MSVTRQKPGAKIFILINSVKVKNMTLFVTASACLLFVGLTAVLPAGASTAKGIFQVRMTIQAICTTLSGATADNRLIVTCENNAPVLVTVTPPEAEGQSPPDYFTENVNFSLRKRGIKNFLTVIYRVPVRAETTGVMKTPPVYIRVPYYEYRSGARDSVVTITVTY